MYLRTTSTYMYYVLVKNANTKERRETSKIITAFLLSQPTGREKPDPDDEYLVKLGESEREE